MNLNLGGSTVLLTCGASGIGRAVAAAFRAEGAHVSVLDRGPRPAGESTGVLWRQGDVTDEATVARTVKQTVARFGGLDVAVGCAMASGPMGEPTTRIRPDEFSHPVAVNLTGHFLLAKHAARAMYDSGGGSVVMVGSVSSVVSAPGTVPYCAANGGVLMLTRALAVDLDAHGIRVNCVCPRTMDTPLSRMNLGLAKASSDSQRPAPLPQGVVRSILFFASPASAGINGAAQILDFGGLAHPFPSMRAPTPLS
ncbi:SDR family NAD(P)-dependent oxidoreductase [Streptomyces lydicus]|uniref:SDR family NAD(P)-dependent oxidoreductase n=1 Tax=Streptomyces lydicus TaxID=47763 RepID=UPI00379491C1